MVTRIKGSGIEFPDSSKQVKAAFGVPPGAIMDFGGSTPPEGWLACNGAAVSRVDEADLFNAIGTLWGVGDGSTTFNVPNFITGEASIQGDPGVSSNGQMPSHTHVVSQVFGSAAAWTMVTPGANSIGHGSITSGAAGSGTRNFAAGKGVLKCIKK